MFPIKYETDDTHCSPLPPETCNGPRCLVEGYICVLAHEAFLVWPGSSCQPPLSLLSTSDFIPHCTSAYPPTHLCAKKKTFIQNSYHDLLSSISTYIGD